MAIVLSQYHYPCAGRPKTSLNSAALRRPAPESPIAKTTCSTSPLSCGVEGQETIYIYAPLRQSGMRPTSA